LPISAKLVRLVLDVLPAVTEVGPDDNAGLFAAALETRDDSVGDADAVLRRELEIASMLAASGTALDPDPETRTRAKHRLLAALANEAEPWTAPRRGTALFGR